MDGNRRIPKDKIRRYLTDPDTFATTVHAILLDLFGESIYEADPLDIYLDVREVMGEWMPVELENKWNALNLCLNTERFFTTVDGFRAVCTTLIDGEPDIDTDEDPTFLEIAWALHEVEFNREDKVPFDQLADPAINAIVDRVVEDEVPDIDSPEFQMSPDDPTQAELVEMAQKLEHQLLDLGISPVTKTYVTPTESQPTE